MLEPQAMSCVPGSTTRIWRADSRALRPYSRAVMWPICHGPSISLPRHQYRTLCGSCVAVLPAQVAPPGALVEVAVLDVGHRLLGGARAQVETQQRLGAHELAPLDEVVGAELVRLERVPGSLQDGRPLVPGADAVEPVVARDEVPARVAHDRHPEPLDLRGDVAAEPAGVRQLGTRFVDAGVHRPPEVLQEGSQQATIHLRAVPGALEDRAGGPSCLRVTDAAQPGARSEGGAGAAKAGYELTTGGKRLRAIEH